MRTALRFALPLLLLALGAGCGARDASLAPVMRSVRAQYPEVRRVTTDSLSAWMKQGTPLVLLDVRTVEEYEVSHLRDALRVEPETDEFSFLENTPHDTPIVAYCSVGYRAADLCRRLMQAGYTNVMNLEGALFKWANEGRPVYRGHEQVEEVHPHRLVWGKLLKRKLRASSPSAP